MTRHFTCPQCGGSHFGTLDFHLEKEQWVRWCHDEFGVGCQWRGLSSECMREEPKE